MLATAQKFGTPKLNSYQTTIQKRTLKNEIPTTMTNKKQSHLKILTQLLLILISISSCQTTGSSKNQQIKQILTAQNALIEATLDERNQRHIIQAVAESGPLSDAERHLQKALVSIKGANRKLSEVINSGTSICK